MRPLWLPLMLTASTAFALPPNSPYREGANHHVGDDSFVAKYGRRPDGRDSEKQRMRTHLEHVRGVLAASPATRPDLEARRAELLGYLDDYIAQGITPENRRLPWRTPVFIDEHGAICAVGYLIERSAGRALPEQIAAAHRYDFLEDIAAAMPEVQAWIDGSGLTLDELASIQPGYIEPSADTWQRWDLAQIPDGPYERKRERESGTTRGTFAKHRMEGAWTRHDLEGHLVGKGEMKAGAGAWTSFYPDGKKLAEGRYAGNDPAGPWTFFHESGNVAAVGSFSGGTRVGKWQFFHDTPARTPIAIGRFSDNGTVIGTWRHFDATGALLATSRDETPSEWTSGFSDNSGGGTLLIVVPGADRIRHRIHVGTQNLERYQLDSFELDRERVYVQSWGYGHDNDTIYDDAGRKLEKIGDGWQASDCKWGGKRKQIARDGDLARLHSLLYKDLKPYRWSSEERPGCGERQPIDAARGQRIDALLASRDVVRAQAPKFVRDVVLDEVDTSSMDDDQRREHEDLVRLLRKHMTFYVEWPHVDGLFLDVFRTVPGHVVRLWSDKMMEHVVEE